MTRYIERFEDRISELRILDLLEDGFSPPGIDCVQAMMKLRFQIACAEVGEPVLHDQMKDVPTWVEQRMVELCEGIPGHQSAITMIFENQHLWAMSDREELEKGITRTLADLPPTTQDLQRAA